MDVNILLTRALSGLGKNTKYKSPGKMPPFSASSWSPNIVADCSGFIDWCLRFSPSRQVDHPLYKKVNGGWFETTAIHKDGLSDSGFFSKLENPKIGAMLVYPDFRGNDGRMHDGHIGIINEVNGGSGVSGVKKVIHCSLGNSNNLGDAIQVTGPDPWLRHSNSIVVWFEGLTSEQTEEVELTVQPKTKIIKELDISKQIYYELTPERLAILDLIAYTEGTDREIGKTKKGYDILYSFKTFSDFSDHPRKVIKSGGISSSAAGRYQILTGTWDWIQKRLKKTGFKPFPSFAPEYQDQAALFLIDAKKNSIKAVDDKNLDEFLDVCSWEWASLPDPDTGKGRYPPQSVVNIKKIADVYNQLFDLWNA